MVCFRYIIVNTLHKGDNMDDDNDDDNNNNNVFLSRGNKHSIHTCSRKASRFISSTYTTVPISEMLYRCLACPVLSWRTVVWNNRLVLASSLEIYLSSSSSSSSSSLHLTVGPSITYSVVNASLNNQIVI